MNNPFNPSFGKVPPVFIDREKVAEKLIEGLSNPDSPYQTTIISGVRGVGKTALLTDVCKNISRNGSWIVADIPSQGNILENLVQNVQAQMSSDLRKAFEKVDGFSVPAMGVGIGYSSAKDAEINYQLILEELLQKMQKQGKRLLVVIDEIIASESVRFFASVYQILIRKDYPIAFLMTGLPKNISELLNDKVLTFLLRSARINLPMLNNVNIQYTYKKTFAQADKTIEQEALKKMTALTNGYSYGFQLLGYLLWETGKKEITISVVESVIDEYKENLFRNAYTKIYEELSGVDREFVIAMARTGCDSVQMRDISDGMRKTPGYVSTYKKRLLDAGVIIPSGYGYVSFSLPLFRDYITEFWA